jgi:hypothetical protein
MRDVFPALRRAAIAVIAVLSVLVAVLLVWVMASRETIGVLSNAQLMGILSLLLLPGATFAAWEVERRAAQRAADREAARLARNEGVHAHAADGSRHGAGRHRRRVGQGARESAGR